MRIVALRNFGVLGLCRRMLEGFVTAATADYPGHTTGLFSQGHQDGAQKQWHLDGRCVLALRKGTAWHDEMGRDGPGSKAFEGVDHALQWVS